MNLNTENIALAFSLTLFAGLSTGIGSAMAFFTKRTNTRFLAVALGFSAGVMIYVSFIEIMHQAKATLNAAFSGVTGDWIATGAFFGGFLLAAAIDKLVPSFENPHEVRKIEDIDTNKRTSTSNHKLMRMGLFSAIAIAVHNFPEGLATFTAALKDPSLGITIAVAIAIHNIPEGIAVSIPVFFATGNRRKAFTLSFLSGLAEPFGALAGYFILMPFLSETLFGIVFAAIAGIMVFISVDELLPSAREYGEHHLSIYGLASGMALMAVSLLLFA